MLLKENDQEQKITLNFFGKIKTWLVTAFIYVFWPFIILYLLFSSRKDGSGNPFTFLRSDD